MTNETSLLIPAQALVPSQSQLPVQEMVSQQKPTIAVLSNWQEQMSPTHCLWSCTHEELLSQNPNIAFPAVEQCLLLIGNSGETDFFGHFTPLTAGVTGAAVGQLVHAIDKQPSAPQTEEPGKQNKKLAIYTIGEDDSVADTPPAVAVEDFRMQFEKVGYEVELHTLPHTFFGKTLVWDTQKQVFEPSDTSYSVPAQVPFGNYLSEKIFAEDG